MSQTQIGGSPLPGAGVDTLLIQELQQLVLSINNINQIFRPPISVNTQTLSSQTASTSVAIVGSPYPLAPGLLAKLSVGANLTYNIEGSGDGTNWSPLPSGSALTATTVLTLPCSVAFVRANVTTYTGGSLVFSVCQF